METRSKTSMLRDQGWNAFIYGIPASPEWDDSQLFGWISAVIAQRNATGIEVDVPQWIFSQDFNAGKEILVI